MSSAGEQQDVAELAQAINSHADVLYESWRTSKDNNLDRSLSAGPPPVAIIQQVERPLYDIIALKRMEDTLELLADPSLTPKLEHLVSNFVRKDKAKRQHNAPSPSPSNASSRRSSSPVKMIPIQKENGVMINGIGQGQNPKKPLPKSILAAVQRFEPSEVASGSQSDGSLSGIKTSHSSPTVNLPGIGAISRDVLQGESSLSNRVSEKTYRLKSPIRTILNNHHSEARDPSPQPLQQISSTNNFFHERQLRKSNSNSSVSSGNGSSREIHIPIERIDENGARSKLVERKSSSPAPDIRKPSRHQFSNIKDDLEREEEKLVNALRTSQITTPGSPAPQSPSYLQNRYSPGPSIESHNVGRQSPIRIHRIEVDGSPYHTHADGTSSNHIIIDTNDDNALTNGNNANSRIAFAKERIRHCQEHPLTQQRLELQKQLPSPSSSLAAAIAVQQGKIKFQPSSTSHHQHQPHFPPHEDSHQHHHRVEHQDSRENGAGAGRQNWVSNMLKFGPGGSSSVAERVQLFEKYPAPAPMGNLRSQCRDGSLEYVHSPNSDHTGGGRVISSKCHPNDIKPLSIHIKDPRHQNEVYYTSPSSPVSIPSPLPLSPPHSPREITHTIRTSPDLTMSANSSRKMHPVQTEIKLHNSNAVKPTNHSVSYAHGDSMLSENPVVAPWRHNTVATVQHDLTPQKQNQVKPDALSPKSKKFGSRSTVPSIRLALNSENIGLIDDGNNNKQFTLPRFYWAEGKLPPTSYVKEVLTRAQEEYSKLRETTPQVTEAEFGQYITSLGIPLYWKKPFWLALGLAQDSSLDFETFLKFYHRLVSECPDDASRFIRILWTQARVAKTSVSNNQYKNNFQFTSNGSLKNDQLRFSDTDEPPKLSSLDIGMSDFIPMIQDIIDTHPGLGFLREAPEFHSRYVTTVVSRIFYMVNRSWTGRITLQELRRSNILRVIKRLEEETDVNNITEYFSYEHFYVIYCKFWELDKDHDLLIDKTDLSAHSEHALSSRIIDRIFSGAVIRGWDMTSTTKCSTGKMTYSDFVWFLISEEDKKTPTAIEYWFRCLDIDGDGMLSPYELQFFYSEQEKRIECLGIEPLDFSNIYCQIIDMLRCSPTGIRLKDLKKNPQLASNMFNTLFNLDKYLDHEQRDPFSAAGSGPNLSIGESGTITHEMESDWDKYAAMEYDLLIAEETPSEAAHDTVSDFEDSPGSPGCHAP